MDVRMDYEKTKQMVKDKGWNGFIKHINKYYSEYDLYSCSQDWFNNPRYTCKLKGASGDVVIGWHGFHEY